MGNIDFDADTFSRFEKISSFWEIEKVYEEGEYAGFYGQVFDNSKENFFVSYLPKQALKMKIKNFRVEFNPAKSSFEHLNYVFDVILPLLEEVGISRIDIALDFERDLSAFTFGGRAKKRIYYGSDSRIETRYAGSGDEIKIRLYDKKRERIEKGDKVAQEKVQAFDELWRLEFELHGSGYILNQLKKDFRALSETPISALDLNESTFIELSTQEKIMIRSKDDYPELFADLAKATKAKYNALSKKAKIVNLVDITRMPLAYINLAWDYPQEVNLMVFLWQVMDKKNPLKQGGEEDAEPDD